MKRKCCQSLGRWRVSIGRTEWTKLATRSLSVQISTLYKIRTTNKLCTKFVLQINKICTRNTLWKSNKYKDMLQVLKYTNCVAVHIVNIPKRWKSKHTRETNSLKIQKKTLGEGSGEEVLFDTILQYGSLWVQIQYLNIRKL